MIDDDGRLLLIKRTKPGQAPYWTTPGGGVEDTDESVEAALQRELAEELGVEASAWPAACTPCSKASGNFRRQCFISAAGGP